MTSGNDDWACVEQINAGDEQAFNVLMERYKRPILNFVYRMTGDAVEAEDVAQDVFVRAYRNIFASRVRQGHGLFSTWLFQVARNAALDSLRRRKRHPVESLAAMDNSGKSVPGTGRTASQESEARETAEQIAAAVAALPEDQRTAFVLAEYNDLAHAEIAAIMGCSVKSVESRLYRAKLFLRERLKEIYSPY